MDHYTFTDASGAQYRLNQNSSGIWTSNQSVYLTYNASTQTFTLYNPWGSQIQLSWSQIAANFDSFTYLQALSPRS